VTDAAGDTETGRFETAAPLGEFTGLTFGVSGDWRGELAPYPAISNVAEKNLAFFVEHGDTIYADDDSPGVLAGTGNPKPQAETLAEFRAKHNEVYSTRFGENAWADLRASTSIFATIDDHEVTNNFAGGQRIVDDPRFLESFPDDDPHGLINDSSLYELGMQAFQEYNPIRDMFYGGTGDAVTANERQLYRYNTFGSDAATFVIDTRSFRDPELEFTDANGDGFPDDPVDALTRSLTEERTLLGKVQLEDLKADLLNAETSGITWKFVMIPEPIQNIFPGINLDAYEGYGKERTELLQFIDENDISNVVFVAADVHMTAVNNLTYQTEPFGEQIALDAFEITTGAVAYQEPTGAFLANVFTAANPELNALYNSLPIAPDMDSQPNDKDDFVKTAINDTLLTPLGFDPLGLDDNLPQADGLINATLLQGDYYVGHSYSWTEFDIDPEIQKLTITTWGIDGYTEAELLENPDAIVNQVPEILSQFEVLPSGSGQGFPMADVMV
jgi:alkaline phosphatase D